MERTNTALLNGHKAAATEESAATQERGNGENLLAESPRAIAQTTLSAEEVQTLPPEEETQHPEPSPRKRRPNKLILAALGIGAIVAGTFGYRWWQYTSTHEETENAVESLSPASGSQFALLPPDNAAGNFTKVVQRIPVKIVFDSQSIQGYESRITPGMSAVVDVELK